MDIRIRPSFALLACGLLTACVQELKTDPDTLVIGIKSEIKSLDFHLAIDAEAEHAFEIFLQGLVTIGEDFKPRPDFAQNFQTTDAQNYTFTLPSDRRFHDGTLVTCADVKGSFDLARAPESRIRAGLDVITTMECEGNIFRLHLRTPVASFLNSEVARVKIVPITPAGPRPLVGSGPYKLAGTHDRDITFVRSEFFPNQYAYKKIIVRTIEDPTTLFLSLVGGDVDYISNSLAPTRALEAAKNPYLTLYRGPGVGFQYLGLNLRSPKLKDLRVRRALSLAIDRNDLIAHKLMGFATPATVLLPPGNPYRNNQVSPLEFNPTRARELLRAAHAENLEIELKSSSDRDVVSTLLVIQRMLQNVGIRAPLKPMEFGTFFADVQKGSFEMFALRWPGITDPDLLNRIFHSSELPPGRNRTFYSNAHVDSWLDAAIRHPNFEKRRELYGKVQQAVVEDLPYIPLWYPDNVVIATKFLRNFKLSPRGSWDTLLRTEKRAP
ncbi:MAG: ABC transporter substrate-binding protein [Bdellovibrionales bacterium]|nr:ABC transporter substrate-binding protein [Bdellovibrionales bacterium]